MRPAVMIGTEDRILNRWAQFAKKYGFLPLFGDGSTKYVQICSWLRWTLQFFVGKFEQL